MVNNKKHLSFVFLFIAVLLSGCWDETEIEDLAFLSAVAIDLKEKEGDSTIFEMTEQLIVPAGLSTLTQSGEEKAYRNLSQTGESIFEINREIARQENRQTNIEHLSLVIVSKEIAEEEKMLANVLDVFIRQQYMRRGILLAIADGKAKDFLELEPEHITVPARYITELMENTQSLVTTEPTRFGEVQERLLTNRSYKIPLLSIYSKDSINYGSIAVMQEPMSKLVGVLEEDEAKGMQIILGENAHGTVQTKLEGEIVSFEISEATSKYKLLNGDKNHLSFRIDIDVTADIMEYFGTVDFRKEKNLQLFEKLLEEEVLRLTEQTLTKLQDDLETDVMELDNYLRTRHHKVWEEVKDDWDHGENYFSQSEITVHVNPTVTEPGTSTKVNEEGGS